MLTFAVMFFIRRELIPSFNKLLDLCNEFILVMVRSTLLTDFLLLSSVQTPFFSIKIWGKSGLVIN